MFDHRIPARILSALAGLVLMLPPALLAQKGSGDGMEFNDLLPQDPAVRTGTLPNGLTYYIRANGKPEKRAELRLAVRAGSALEDDSQLGLAHFVEHMAFNGTKNFAKNKLVEYLESIGMRFGADLNAYTSFDQTVYMLQVPTDVQEDIDQGLLILADWAGEVVFEEKEIDAERGVVIEEWRARRSGDSRVGDQHFKVSFMGSRYADRMPIGTKENLETFDYETLRRFYRTWYRPDLMAVVAVGDFDPATMEAAIRKRFSGLAMPKNPVPRPQIDIPVFPATRFSIASDPEASGTSIGINIRHQRVSRNRVGDYVRTLADNMVSQMLSQRLDELRQKADPPFVLAFANAGLSLGNYREFSIDARVREGEYLKGFEALLTEMERVRRYGFTEAELERAKKGTMRGIEQYYAERDKTESGSYAREYVGNFTSEESFPGIEFEYKLYQKYVPQMTLDQINTVARELMKEDNRVVSVSGPDAPTNPMPTETELKQAMAEVLAKSLKPYAEDAVVEKLMSTPPTPGRVVQSRTIDELGVTEWTLSNGVRVVLKPTQFKNDEILLSAYSPGGSSLVPDGDYIAAATATTLVLRGGAGEFDRITLDKFLSDKVAGVSPGIGDLYETMGGSASNEDLETMFQLLYLYATAPRKDPTALLSYKATLQGLLQTKGTRPEQVFGDSVNWISSGRHFRARPWEVSMLNELDLDKSMRIYKERFGDMGDFTFFLVGSFDPQGIKPLVETYLASLPSANRKENWRDVGMRMPEGIIRKEVRKGMEEKSQVQLVYSGKFDFTMENRHKLQSLVEVLRMKLRETLREEKGGVYSPGAGASYSQYPNSEYQIVVFFGCDPNRAEELIGDVESIVSSLMSREVDQEYIEKVKEIQRRERETSLQENRFWLSSLQYYYQNNEAPANLLQYGELYKTLTPALIKEQAKTYLNGKNRMTFILYPENAGK